MEFTEIFKCMACFSQSFINAQGELIVHREANSYFKIADCESKLDIKCKILEWLSRDAYKTCPFHKIKQNIEFHNFILNGINKYLETNFTEDDMDIIYTYLGNACNHDKTIKFILSGYDLKVLEE